MKKFLFAVVAIAVVALAIVLVMNVNVLDLQHPNYASDYAQYMKSTPEVYVDANGKTWQYDDERGPLYTNEKETYTLNGVEYQYDDESSPLYTLSANDYAARQELDNTDFSRQFAIFSQEESK